MKNITKKCECGNEFITSEDDSGIACFECIKLISEESERTK